jgi:23S rRNA (guanosine2251-2'-O)-methyltransferase
VHGVVVPTRGAAQINGDAMKTSSGALNFVPVCRENDLWNAIKYLKNSGFQVVACTEKSSDFIYHADYSIPTVIIMGSEEDGISENLLQEADARVKIPLKGRVESLNVSVATGIILFEAVRQREFV